MVTTEVCKLILHLYKGEIGCIFKECSKGRQTNTKKQKKKTTTTTNSENHTLLRDIFGTSLFSPQVGGVIKRQALTSLQRTPELTVSSPTCHCPSCHRAESKLPKA